MNLSPLTFKKGVKDGIPIGLGYLSVSFGFGITAVSGGISVLQAVLISMTNLTSAGQLAGVGIITAGGALLELILTQLTINLRYALMGVSLSQKLDDKYTICHRLLMGFGLTDEIFGVSSAQKGAVGPSYFYGLMTTPYIGWALGTFLGALAGNLLPEDIRLALGIMMYAMFVAIVVPPAKKDKKILGVVGLAILFSCVLAFVPFFSSISNGYAIIISSLLSAGIMAIFFPAEDDDE